MTACALHSLLTTAAANLTAAGARQKLIRYHLLGDDHGEQHCDPRPLIPALAPLYAHTADLSWLIVRATAGLMLLPHGIPKVFTQGVAAFAAAGLARRGIEPALPLAYVVAFLETVGGAVHRARPVHALLRGRGRDRDGGDRLGRTSRRVSAGPTAATNIALFWGLIMLAIALRGGGPYSLDRRIGKEL